MIVLLLALMSGGLAGFSALQYLRQRPQPLIAASAPRGTDVVVAARDLPLGAVLAPEDVIAVRWPVDAVPAGYAQTPDQVLGRGLLTPVRMNEPLLDVKLGEKGLGGGLPIIIPEGMRGLAVRVDEEIAVAGFVVPGTRVDVLLTITPPNDNQPLTTTILQNVQALTTGQTIQREEDGKAMLAAVITLLLTPEQAERVTLAQSQGRIKLSLRNLLDLEEVNTPGVRIAGLLDGTRPAARVATGGGTVRAPVPTQTQPQTVQIETMRGGNRALVTFGRDSIRN
jgi:pilus assembly protein CpaB